MRINITIPQTILTKLDSYAKDHTYTRSEAIREAIRRLYNEPEAVKPIDDIYVVRDFSKKAQTRGLER